MVIRLLLLIYAVCGVPGVPPAAAPIFKTPTDPSPTGRIPARLPQSHGGARSGAGRKTNAQRHGPPKGHTLLDSFVVRVQEPPVALPDSETPNDGDSSGRSNGGDNGNENNNANNDDDDDQPPMRPPSPPRPLPPSPHNDNVEETEIGDDVEEDVDEEEEDDYDDYDEEDEEIIPRDEYKFSGILQEQMKNIKYKECNKNVEKGILWSRGRDYVPNRVVAGTKKSMNLCWKEFYQYDTFTWRPDLMIQGWKPKCITCNCSDIRVAHRTRPPRLVYAIGKNYI